MTVAGRLARPVDWALRQEPRHGHPAHPRGEARPPAGPRPQPRPPLHRLRRDASHGRLEHRRLTPGPHGGPGAHPGPGAGPALRPLLAGGATGTTAGSRGGSTTSSSTRSDRTAPFHEHHHVLSEALLRAFAVPLEATHEVPDDVSLPTGRAPGRRTGRHRPAPGGRHDHRLADPPIGAAGRWDNSGPRASRVPPPGKSGAWGRNLRRWPGPGRPRAPAPGLERPVSRPAPLTAPAGRPRCGPGGAPLPQAGRRAYMSWTSAAWKRATWCVGGSGSS